MTSARHITTNDRVRGAVRHLLRHDHVGLVQLFDDVLALLRENDRDQIRAAWTMFESALTAHLQAEEALIFPAFRMVDPVEVQALSNDHARFRKNLDELGIAVDLHMVRADAAREFIDSLKAHSKREDACMYPWAESHLDHVDEQRLHERLRAGHAARR